MKATLQHKSTLSHIPHKQQKHRSKTDRANNNHSHLIVPCINAVNPINQITLLATPCRVLILDSAHPTLVPLPLHHSASASHPATSLASQQQQVALLQALLLVLAVCCRPSPAQSCLERSLFLKALLPCRPLPPFCLLWACRFRHKVSRGRCWGKRDCKAIPARAIMSTIVTCD